MAEIEIRRLGPDDAALLGRVAEGVFDHPVRPDRAAAFLACPSHLMVVARADGLVVGMGSAVVYLHPDKDPQMWINEIGTGDAWRRQGIATRVLRALFAEAEARGCDYAWLGTEEDNAPARALYRRAGGEETTGLVLYNWGKGS